ncbi:hypothetical protein [Pectinatus frisingensis]|uniref:hypothetical protein n=1 Tax=Pectinatus frisingensis TaxID=865 RepID=UPI0018C58E89|nr:hypothetical protein [Pectinatus frisingensis]
MEGISNLFVSCGKIYNKLYCNNIADGTWIELELKTGVCKQLNATNIYLGNGWNNGGDYFLEEDGIVYLVENNMKRLAWYDTSLDEGGYYFLNGINYTDVLPNASCAVIYNHRLYIFPRFDTKIIVFNIQDKKIEKYIQISNIVYNHKKNFNIETALFPCGMHIKNSVWLFSPYCDSIVQYNLILNKMFIYKYPIDTGKCIDVSFFNDDFYILDIGGNIIKWSPLTQKQNIVMKTGKPYPAFGRVVVTEKNIWVLPAEENEIIFFDHLISKLVVYDEYPLNFHYILRFEHQSKYFRGCDDKEWYYFAMCASNYMLTINKYTGKAHWIKPIPVPWSERRKFLERLNYPEVSELQGYTLNNLINLTLEYTMQKNIKYINVGNKILNVTLGECK